MLIVRAPTRISLAGGGTDLEAYYLQYGGIVVSGAIDKYSYVVVQPSASNHVDVVGANYNSFSDHPLVNGLAWNGGLALPRAALKHFRIRRGLSVTFGVEVPPGTGLGSSSSLSVGMVQALSVIAGHALPRAEVAEIASKLEIERLGMPIGRQDQYAAAFGGLNVITFSKDGVIVEPLQVSRITRHRLEQHLTLFFTGSSRHSSDILRHQQRRTAHAVPQVIESLHAIKAFAIEMRSAIEAGRIDDVGEILDLSWQKKKTLAPSISNAFVDECYDLARSRGAIGGKLTGAGGGGYLMFYTPIRRQQAVRAALAARGLTPMNFRFDDNGVHVLLNALKLDQSTLRGLGRERASEGGVTIQSGMTTT